MRLVGPYLASGHRSYRHHPEAVLSYPIFVAKGSDRTEVTVVLLVLTGLVRHACPYLNRHA
jgi:hypothetical protein